METTVQEEEVVLTAPFSPTWMQCLGQLLLGHVQWKSNEELGHKISKGKKSSREFARKKRKPR